MKGGTKIYYSKTEQQRNVNNVKVYIGNVRALITIINLFIFQDLLKFSLNNINSRYEIKYNFPKESLATTLL